MRLWRSRCTERDGAVKVGCLSRSSFRCTWSAVVLPQRTARLEQPWQMGVRLFGTHVWVQW